MKYLDPRFRMIAILIDDEEETASMRETALRHAKLVAAECGFTFDEALRVVGITLAGEGGAETPPSEKDHAEGGDTMPTLDDQSEADAHDVGGGQIEVALRADPGRSDRDIARECGASPTTVGKARAALGLGNAARTVSRGGKTYDMAIGDRT